jgi:hypothetical protein
MSSRWAAGFRVGFRVDVFFVMTDSGASLGVSNFQTEHASSSERRWGDLVELSTEIVLHFNLRGVDSAARCRSADDVDREPIAQLLAIALREFRVVIRDHGSAPYRESQDGTVPREAGHDTGNIDV